MNTSWHKNKKSIPVVLNLFSIEPQGFGRSPLKEIKILYTFFIFVNYCKIESHTLPWYNKIITICNSTTVYDYQINILLNFDVIIYFLSCMVNKNIQIDGFSE